jgi:GTP-binding protein
MGAGLGIQFLRHVERSRCLVHLVDVSDASGRDPASDFDTIMDELGNFSEELVGKPMIVVASKIDVAQDESRIAAVERIASERGLPFLRISAVTGAGIDELKREMAATVFAAAE